MRKIVTLLLVFACVMGLTGCNQKEDLQQGNNNMQYFCSGKVLEVHEEYLKLEIFDIGNTNLSEGDVIEVSTDVISADGCPSFVAEEYARVVMAWNMDEQTSECLEALSIYKTDETGMAIAD